MGCLYDIYIEFLVYTVCLLYTSDAADDLLCVDLGGRRIIKKIYGRSNIWVISSKKLENHWFRATIF